MQGGKRVPVSIDSETYDKITAYSESTGIPKVRVVAEALKDWFDTIGAARLDAIMNSKRVVEQHILHTVAVPLAPTTTNPAVSATAQAS